MCMSQYVDAWESPMRVMAEGVREIAQDVAGTKVISTSFIVLSTSIIMCVTKGLIFSNSIIEKITF